MIYIFMTSYDAMSPAILDFNIVLESEKMKEFLHNQAKMLMRCEVYELNNFDIIKKWEIKEER